MQINFKQQTHFWIFNTYLLYTYISKRFQSSTDYSSWRWKIKTTPPTHTHTHTHLSSKCACHAVCTFTTCTPPPPAARACHPRAKRGNAHRHMMMHTVYAHNKLCAAMLEASVQRSVVENVERGPDLDLLLLHSLEVLQPLSYMRGQPESFKNGTGQRLLTFELIYSVSPVHVCSNRYCCNLNSVAISVAAYMNWEVHIHTIYELTDSTIYIYIYI